MVTYIGSLFDDEKEKLGKIVSAIDKKLETAMDVVAMEYWNEQKTIFKRKILDYELKEIQNSV